MTFEEYALHDGMALAGLVARGEVTSAELVAVACSAIDALNPQLNFVAQDLRAGINPAAVPTGPFAGVPFMVKDLSLSMAGEPDEAGSNLLAGHKAGRDHNLMTRFRAAGLVTIARTTTSEFGAQLSTESRRTGVTRNPWSLAHTPGGSSGGSAAAVASGAVPVAHANDGIGSIRVPAANCGLFGLKLTRQRTPSGPDFGETLGGRGSEFVLTRSIRDAAALLDCTHGADVGAPNWAPPPRRPYADEVAIGPERLRIALMTRTFSGAAVHPSCAAATVHAGRLCSELGHAVEEAAPEFDWVAYRGAIRTEAFANFSAGMDYFAALTGRVVGPNTLEPLNLLAYEEGRRVSLRDYLASIATYGMIQRTVGGFFERYDILLTPVLSRPTALIGELGRDPTDLEAYWDEFSGDAYSPFTGAFNVTGHPAASIPLGFDEAGLPIGTQLVGRFGREDDLIGLAAQLERAQPWSLKLPPLHLSRLDASSRPVALKPPTPWSDCGPVAG